MRLWRRRRNMRSIEYAYFSACIRYENVWLCIVVVSWWMILISETTINQSPGLTSSKDKMPNEFYGFESVLAEGHKAHANMSPPQVSVYSQFAWTFEADANRSDTIPSTITFIGSHSFIVALRVSFVSVGHFPVFLHCNMVCTLYGFIVACESEMLINLNYGHSRERHRKCNNRK